MSSVRLILLIMVLCSYSYGEGSQPRFRGFQGISPDKEVRAALLSPYKLTYRLISRREFEKLADRPWQPLEQELTKTPAPVKRPYTVTVRNVPYMAAFVNVTLYMHTLGNLVVKDEVKTAYEFSGHFRSPFTGELYTFFTAYREDLTRGVNILPEIEIFSRGKLLRNIGPGELFLSPDRRYILQTGRIQLYTRDPCPCQVFPNYKGSPDYFLEGNAPPHEERLKYFIIDNVPAHVGCWIGESEVIRPTLFDLQSPDLPDLDIEWNNKEIELLFGGQANRHEAVRVWGVKDSSKSFILEVKVTWLVVRWEGYVYVSEEPMHEKTYYLLFSLEDSGLD